MNPTDVKRRPIPTSDHLPPGTERLLTRPQAAEMLGLAPRTLANYACMKPPVGPPMVRVGLRSARYRLSDLTVFIAELETVAAGR